MIGDSADMCEGQSKGFTGAKNIGLDDAGNSVRGSGTLENSLGLQRIKAQKQKGVTCFSISLWIIFFWERVPLSKALFVCRKSL
jgi:hypothetical protein